MAWRGGSSTRTAPRGARASHHRSSPTASRRLLVRIRLGAELETDGVAVVAGQQLAAHLVGDDVVRRADDVGQVGDARGRGIGVIGYTHAVGHRIGAEAERSSAGRRTARRRASGDRIAAPGSGLSQDAGRLRGPPLADPVARCSKASAPAGRSGTFPARRSRFAGAGVGPRVSARLRARRARSQHALIGSSQAMSGSSGRGGRRIVRLGVDRTDLLADVAAEDPVADGGGLPGVERARSFDGQIADAASRVDRLRRHERPGRAAVQAPGAGAAARPYRLVGRQGR